MKLKRVTVKDGRYYYIQDLEDRSKTTGKPKQKWHKLSRVNSGEAALHKSLAELLGDCEKQTDGNIARVIREFQKIHLPSLSPSVRKEYERMFRVIANGFSLFDVGEVIPGDVLEFLKQFDATPTARHHYKARLSTFFSWCVLKNYITTSPCDKVQLSAPPKCKGKWDEEQFWLLHAALPPIGQAFLELCFLTRQRSTDIRLLQESRIGRTHIYFQPSKTINSSGEETHILITPDIQSALDRARKLAKVKGLPGGSGYLIQTCGGAPYTATGLRSMFARACKAVGLPTLPPKSIRPFALKAMENAGHDLREIQKAAAHTTSATTEGYLNQYRDRVSNAVTTLPTKSKT